MSCIRAFVMLAFLVPVTCGAEPLFIVKHYTGFTVYIDCRHNGPIAYEMPLVSDQGNVERPSGDFKIDTTVPTECQMSTGGTFQVTDAEEATLGKFQRGHLADANALDSVQQSMTDSFFVTNMLPQAARFKL